MKSRFFNSIEYKRVIIKVGTQLIMKKTGRIDLTFIQRLVDQIATLRKQGKEVLLVSSGSMGAGRKLLNFPEQIKSTAARQVLASTGQILLMETYRKRFQKRGLLCAQILITKDDFRDQHHYFNLKNCLEALLQHNVIPIINENDAVSVEELMFTDNDQLASFVSSTVNADLLLLLTNVSGIFYGHPDCASSHIIDEIHPDHPLPDMVIAPMKSALGRGGMHTKYRIGMKLASMGIPVIIANGQEKEIILHITAGEKKGTYFRPKKPLSHAKQWIAHKEGEEKGKITIDKEAKKAIFSSQQANSLLPVGITKIGGCFIKGDLVKIYDEKENDIGLGKARYSARELEQYLGKPGSPLFIHYDYLYLFS